MGDNKICILCAHWVFNGGWAGTDKTPGDQWESHCTQHKHKISGDWADEEDWRRYIKRAEECPSFDPAEER